jgi:hypothetical protein
MPTLNDILGAPGVRTQVVADCERLVEEEVSSKGLLGMPIKAAYAIVKAIKPGFVPEVIDHLLDDFARRLDPLYQQAKSKNEPVTAHFNARPGEVAEALLAITDERARRTTNNVLKSAYDKLRPAGKKHVEAAVPRISRLVDKYDKSVAPAAAPVTA